MSFPYKEDVVVLEQYAGSFRVDEEPIKRARTQLALKRLREFYGCRSSNRVWRIFVPIELACPDVWSGQAIEISWSPETKTVTIETHRESVNPQFARRYYGSTRL